MPKTFIDTNIVVYANDKADPRKQELGQSRHAVSRQTLILERFEGVPVTGGLVRDGHELAEDLNLSFWDGVILAAAVRAQAAGARCSVPTHASDPP